MKKTSLLLGISLGVIIIFISMKGSSSHRTFRSAEAFSSKNQSSVGDLKENASSASELKSTSPQKEIVPSVPAPLMEASDPEKAVAKVSVKGRESVLNADSLRVYPRVYIEPQQKIPVSLHFPQGEPHEPIFVRVEDGGKLDDGVPGKAIKLDSDKNIQFQFQANQDPGVYHVVARQGTEDWTLDFWVGPEMPVAQR